MNILTAEQYEELCARADILQKDGHGLKVLKLADGQIVKIFRRKHLLSSAWLRPYARRFQKNAARLASIGINTVRVNRLFRCPSQARHLVVYEPLAGTCLRDYLAEKPENSRILGGFAGFLADLHAKGVYFRSIHFGNVIVLPDAAGFGLIDIADLSFRSPPLPFRLRLRNFRHFLRYREDRESLQAFGVTRFVEVFARGAGLSERQAKLLTFSIESALRTSEK